MILIAAAAALLAVKGGWAAFRDGNACRAVAEPVRRTTGGTRPFAAIVTAPGQRPMLSFRLGRPPPDARATLTVNGRSLPMSVTGDMAHTADPALIDSLRTAPTVTIRTRNGFAIYDLRGFPTALDAALAGCASRR